MHYFKEEKKMAEENRFGTTKIETLNYGTEGVENGLLNTNTRFGSRKINELNVEELQKILQDYGVVEVQENAARLTRILVKVLTTTQLADTFGINSNINTKSEAAKIEEIPCPRWMRKCRIGGISEGDIKIIAIKLAKTDQEFRKILASDMEKTEITSGSKGLILEILEEYRILEKRLNQ